MTRRNELCQQNVWIKKGWWRIKILVFLVSPEEYEMIESAMRLSGLTK